MLRAKWAGLLALCVLASCGSISADEVECGNGKLEPGEQCDDANAASGDGCSSSCAIEMTCGNGAVEGTEQCDDGDLQSRDGCSSSCTTESQYTYATSWSFRTIANAIQGCPNSYDTIAVYSQPITASGANDGTPIIDLFDCTAGTGTIAPLYEGRYRVWLESTNANATMKYASSTSVILDLAQSGQSFTAIIYTDGGYFRLTWNLVGEASGNALTCASAGTDSVDLISTLTSSQSAYEDIFECTDGSALTAALPAGGYTVSISALNGADQSIGTAPALTNQIQAPNKVTDLGTVTIPITGL